MGEREQQVLGADVLIPQAAGFFNGQLQQLLGTGGEIDLGFTVLAVAAEPLDHFSQPFVLQAKVAQDARSDAFLLLQ